MDSRWATKTRAEREDEEVERLVRPAPKVKPPRHDRRREQISPDRDPDIDGDPDIAGDPDKSRNYKDVGGSVAARIALKFAQGKDKVPAKSKETGRVVYISPDTLKEKPGEYDPVDAEEAENKGKDKPEKSKSDSEESAQGVGDEKLAEAGKAVRQRMEEDPALNSRLKDITNPATQLGGLAKENPNLSLSQIFGGVSFPPDLKTVGDLTRALTAQPKPSKKKVKAPPSKEAPEKAPTKNEESEPSKPSEKEPVEPSKPEVSEKKEPEDSTPEKKEPDDTSSPDDTSEEENRGQESEQARLGIPDPNRPEPSVIDRQEALLLIQDTFPKDVAAELISRRMHPEDVHALVATYTAAQSHPVKDVQAFAEKASRNYESDPSRVLPPSTVRDASGKEVPFDSLPSEEKAEAYRKHQVKVVGLSLAAKKILTSKLTMPTLMGKPQVPKKVASALATFMLRKGDEKGADSYTSQMFQAALGSKGSGMAPGTAKKFLSQLTPGAKKLACSYLDGVDFVEAQRKFIGHGLGQFSEKDSPKAIMRGLRKAQQFFQEKASIYGMDLGKAGAAFRVSVLNKMRLVDRKKYAELRTLVDQDDADTYDKNIKDWAKKYQAWVSRQDSRKKKSDPYRDEGASNDDDPEPQEPQKPARYDLARANSGSGKKKGSVSDPWDEIAQKTASSHVLDRFVTARVLDRFISTCSGTPAMVRDPRVAVYHGINPQENYPGMYPAWSQPHQCDLGEPDFQSILASAKNWLNTPVLSKQIDGVLKDQQLRAALDLAIYDGPYNGQIGAVLYDQLLARLDGGKALTARDISRVSSCPPSPKEDTTVMKPSQQIRQFAARVASSNDTLAFDLIEFADKLAAEEQDDKGQEQEPAQDQGQKQASTDKLTQLRSAVIRTAATNPAAREALKPVLQLLKTFEG